MTPIEAELLLAKAVVLLCLYAFLGAVGLVAWRELQGTRKLGLPLAGPETGTARLIVLDGGESDRPPGTAFALHGVNAIGRDFDNDLVLIDPTLSGRHAVLLRRDGAWWLEDLGSTNGSTVNDLPLGHQKPVPLRSGDVVQLGQVRLRFVVPAGSA